MSEAAFRDSGRFAPLDAPTAECVERIVDAVARREVRRGCSKECVQAGSFLVCLLAPAIGHVFDLALFLWSAYFMLLFVASTLFLARKTVFANIDEGVMCK